MVEKNDSISESPVIGPFYRFLKALGILALHLFFRRILIVGRRHIVTQGPVILVANHPNTLLDPMLCVYATGRDGLFLAKSTLFANKWVARFFKHLPVIPVYRRQDAPQETEKNITTFRACIAALGQGHAIVIMPEGISVYDGRLHPLKTGATRIALQAEAAHGFKLGVKILPVGLNYTRPHAFYADVLCKIGPPISAADYQAEYETDPWEAVRHFTADLQQALEQVTLTLEDPELLDFVEDLEAIYRQEYRFHRQFGVKEPVEEYHALKLLISAVHWFQRHDPKFLQRVRETLQHYRSLLRTFGLSPAILAGRWGNFSLWQHALAAMYLSFGFPLFLYGTINNILAYKLPQWVLHRVRPEREYIATVKLLTGLLGVPLIHGLQTWLIYHLTDSSWWSLAYFISLLPTGRFALAYKHQFKSTFRFLKFQWLSATQAAVVKHIKGVKQELDSLLSKAEEIYLQRLRQEGKPGPLHREGE